MLATLITTLALGIPSPVPAAPSEGAVGPFTRLESRGSTDIELTVDPSASKPFHVVLEGSADAIARVEYTSENGTLDVRTKSGAWNSSGDVRMRVTVRALESIRSSGSGDIRVNGARGDALEVRSSGSGDVRIDGQVGDLDVRLKGSGDLAVERVESSEVQITVLGSGDVEMAGRTGQLRIEIAGSGDFEGKRLVAADRLIAEIMGSGDITACAKGEVDQRTMGSGDVTIRCAD